MNTFAPIKPSEQTPPCLIRLVQGSDTLAPVVLIHAIGGGAFIYQNLLTSLGAPHPVWGVYAPGLWDETRPLVGLRTQAANYYKALISASVRRPALIGGSSYGGIIAFELERIYRSEGHDTLQIALLDSPGPGHIRERDDAEVGALFMSGLVSAGKRSPQPSSDSRAHASDWGDDPGAVFTDALQQLRVILPDRRQECLLRWAKEIIAEITMDDILRQLAVIRQNLENLSGWQPEECIAPIIYFKALECLPGFEEDSEQSWRPLANGGFEIIPTPGNHWTMLFHPNSSVITERLSRRLVRADSGRT